MGGWVRVGYIEGKIKMSEKSTLVERAILYEREPFLWFKTRRAKIIGDKAIIKKSEITSPHYREYKLNLENWLLGGNIEVIREEKPSGEVIKLVFDRDKN